MLCEIKNGVGYGAALARRKNDEKINEKSKDPAATTNYYARAVQRSQHKK
jgi:hypothetical protein